jgi:hypothetical protein
MSEAYARRIFSGLGKGLPRQVVLSHGLGTQRHTSFVRRGKSRLNGAFLPFFG